MAGDVVPAERGRSQPKQAEADGRFKRSWRPEPLAGFARFGSSTVGGHLSGHGEEMGDELDGPEGGDERPVEEGGWGRRR